MKIDPNSFCIDDIFDIMNDYESKIGLKKKKKDKKSKDTEKLKELEKCGVPVNNTESNGPIKIKIGRI